MKRSEMSLIDRFVIGISMAKARYRVALGCCPMCNSDAPELDDCPLCEGYHAARGDDSPPPKELKQRWLDDMHGVKRIKRNIQKLVRESRRKRLAQ